MKSSGGSAALERGAHRRGRNSNRISVHIRTGRPASVPGSNRMRRAVSRATSRQPFGTPSPGMETRSTDPVESTRILTVTLTPSHSPRARVSGQTNRIGRGGRRSLVPAGGAPLGRAAPSRRLSKSGPPLPAARESGNSLGRSEGVSVAGAGAEGPVERGREGWSRSRLPGSSTGGLSTQRGDGRASRIAPASTTTAAGGGGRRWPPPRGSNPFGTGRCGEPLPWAVEPPRIPEELVLELHRKV
jgi:hypothetical protein